MGYSCTLGVTTTSGKERVRLEIKATDDHVEDSDRDDDNQADVVVDVGRLVLFHLVQVEDHAQDNADYRLGGLRKEDCEGVI